MCQSMSINVNNFARGIPERASKGKSMPREANLARKMNKKPERGIPKRVSKRKSMPRKLKLARKGHTRESEQEKKYAPRSQKDMQKRKKGIPERACKGKSML